MAEEPQVQPPTKSEPGFTSTAKLNQSKGNTVKSKVDTSKSTVEAAKSRVDAARSAKLSQSKVEVPAAEEVQPQWAQEPIVDGVPSVSFPNAVNADTWNNNDNPRRASCARDPGAPGCDEKSECTCDPCLCETPPDLSDGLGGNEDIPEAVEELPSGDPEPNYNLNDFVRAKEFFMTSSTKTGISLYDHFTELIRKLLDNRAPENPIDFVEEISLNLKRYRFGMVKDVIQDSYYLSKQVVKNSNEVISKWKKHAMWSKDSSEMTGEDVSTLGGFPNLLRLQYYLEQVNIGLPREEMFKVALFLRQVRIKNPVSRIRFWGKIFGIKGNYFIFEAELKDGVVLNNTWTSSGQKESVVPNSQEEVYDLTTSFPGAGATFQRAGGAVTNPDVLSAYRASSGVNPPQGPPNSGAMGLGNEYLGEQPAFEFADPNEAKEAARWEEYQLELMSGFPQPQEDTSVQEIPAEVSGKGVNRRVFFVWSEWGARAGFDNDGRGWDARRNYGMGTSNTRLDSECIPLNSVTPGQINTTRSTRWFLTGDLDEKVRTFPPFPGREGDYLRALLARITAGTAVSPRGYYRTTKFGEEDGGEDEEEIEEEEEEMPKEDIVYPNKKFRPPNITDLTNPSVDLWVHHASHILRQGRTVWLNMDKDKTKRRSTSDETEDEDELEEEEEDEEDKPKNKEIGPAMFASLAEDKSFDGTTPWSARSSSSVFTEFQVAQVRSNLWPGANALCTAKGKVENIYLGDGLKFYPRSYAPFVPDETQTEYRDGPELTEITDPTVEQEQEWLAKLQLDEIADREDKFVDNEVEGDDEEEEEEEEEEDEEEDEQSESGKSY